MRKGVIDIGSNTINLLIGEYVEGGWQRIAEFKNPARLGKGGIDKNILTEAAIGRGLAALEEHLKKTKELKCEVVEAYATAAVRDASNKDVFLGLVKENLDFDIQVIAGKREAELIALGIKSSGAIGPETNLILDIGGGSTEFILVENGDIKFLQSFQLGVTRLLEKFIPGDPIGVDSQKEITDHIESTLSEIKSIIEKYKPKRLVGASGSFDSLAQIHSEKQGIEFDTVNNEINLNPYHEIAKQILSIDMTERAKIEGLVPHRVETIPMAVLLIDYILSIGDFKEIYQSSYALKEGAMEEGKIDKLTK